MAKNVTVEDERTARTPSSPGLPTGDRRPSTLDDVPLEALQAKLTIVEDRLVGELASGGYRPLPGQTARIAQLRRRQHQLRRAMERRNGELPLERA